MTALQPLAATSRSETAPTNAEAVIGTGLANAPAKQLPAAPAAETRASKWLRRAEESMLWTFIAGASELLVLMGMATSQPEPSAGSVGVVLLLGGAGAAVAGVSSVVSLTAAAATGIMDYRASAKA